jgi:hypothetical protein
MRERRDDAPEIGTRFRRHPAVDAVQDDEIEWRQVAGEQIREGRLVQDEIADAECEGMAARAVDVRAIEIARVKRREGICRGVDDDGRAVPQPSSR